MGALAVFNHLSNTWLFRLSVLQLSYASGKRVTKDGITSKIILESDLTAEATLATALCCLKCDGVVGRREFYKPVCTHCASSCY